MRKIRILHVVQAAGGVDRYIRMLLKYLDKEEFENIMVCSQDFHKEDYKGLADCFEQIEMNRAIGMSDLKSIREVRRRIKKYNPDIVYSAQSGENISGEMREDERYRFYFQDKLEIPILEKSFPHDREILMEILELLVETVTSRKKFLRICGEEKPKEVVKSRLMKLDSMHIQYVMECLKSNTTQVRNIKQYLLATLYNAPTTIDSYYAAQVRHDFGWGGRSN